MQTYIIITIAVLLIVSFIVSFLRVSRVLDTIIIRAPRVIHRAFYCDFCLCFWFAFLFSGIVVLITGNMYYSFMPLFTTNLSKFIL